MEPFRTAIGSGGTKKYLFSPNHWGGVSQKYTNNQGRIQKTGWWVGKTGILGVGKMSAGVGLKIFSRAAS